MHLWQRDNWWPYEAAGRRRGRIQIVAPPYYPNGGEAATISSSAKPGKLDPPVGIFIESIDTDGNFTYSYTETP